MVFEGLEERGARRGCAWLHGGKTAPAALLSGNRPLMLGSLVTAQFMSFSGRILSPSKRSQSVDFQTGEMKR